MAGKIGTIRERRNADGEVTSYRIDISWEGQRHQLGSGKVGDRFLPFTKRSAAEFVLADIRAEASRCGSVGRAVAVHLKRPSDAYLISRWLDRWEAHEVARCEAGEISPRTLGEFQRQRRAGDFDWWNDRYIFDVRFGTIEDWSRALAELGKPKVMRARLLENFRRFMRWMGRRGEIDAVPEFPRLSIERKAPKVYTSEDQAAVLAKIPMERRGIFLAMAHTLRPGEARALDLLEWRQPDLIVQHAMKGPRADSARRGLKESDWRVVEADDELCAWLERRVAGLTPAERLERRGVILFPNPATGARWSHDAVRRTWARAVKAAGLPWVPPYAGTKHSTATDLIRRGANPKELQRFLGHADQRSTDAYVVLASDETKGLKARRGPIRSKPVPRR